MKVMIAAMVCVVIDDDHPKPRHAVACQNPTDDLVRRLRREMQYGRGPVKWRTFDGSKVA